MHMIMKDPVQAWYWPAISDLLYEEMTSKNNSADPRYQHQQVRGASRYSVIPGIN